MTTPPLFGRVLLKILFPKERREEIEGDLEELFHRRVERQGLGPARRLYCRDLASLFRIVRFQKSRTKVRRGDGAMPAYFQDIRYGLRTLMQNRGFTAVSVVTLALGIGANSAIFTLIDATLLQKPQAEAPERILSVYSGREDRPFSSASYPDYVDIRDRNESFSGFAVYGSIGVTWNTGEQTETLSGYIVSGNYFSVLGLQPVSGRFFLAEEDETPGSHPVVVLSHRLWVERFGGSPDVISSAMTLNGHGFTIVGVAPPGFTGRNMVETGDVWIPMMMQAVVRPPRARFYGGMDPDLIERRGMRWLKMFGRLRPDASPEEATSSLDVIARQLADAYPESNTRVRFTVYPALQGDPGAREALVPAATLLMVVVGLVLLIACANVANLQLARAAARRIEFATRAALGAGRRRLMRQALTESVLIALAGAVAGVILAAWTTSLLVPTILEANVLPIRLAVDPFPSSRVLAFTLFVALATALIFGLAPALQATGQNLTEGLRGSDARRRFGLRKALVVCARKVPSGLQRDAERVEIAGRNDVRADDMRAPLRRWLSAVDENTGSASAAAERRDPSERCRFDAR